MALTLINAGRPGDAGAALAVAAALVDGMNPGTDKDRYDQRIKLGYIKIADLYRQISDRQKALALLAKAEEVAGGISAEKYRIDVLVDTAIGHHGVDSDGEARRLLETALGRAETIAGPGLVAEEMTALFEVIAKGAARCEESGVARAATLRLRDWALQIPDDFSTKTEKKVDFLLKASRLLVLAGDRERGMDILAEARTVADTIFVPSRRYAKYINDIKIPDTIGGYDHLIGGHVFAGDIEGALRLAEQIPGSLRDKGMVWLGQSFCRQDDLPLLGRADLDTDRDGLPDFFHPLAGTEERRFGIDPDSDGDGIEDGLDRRPLFAADSDRIDL
jgi:hypothetical protein